MLINIICLMVYIFGNIINFTKNKYNVLFFKTSLYIMCKVKILKALCYFCFYEIKTCKRNVGI